MGPLGSRAGLILSEEESTYPGQLETLFSSPVKMDE